MKRLGLASLVLCTAVTAEPAQEVISNNRPPTKSTAPYLTTLRSHSTSFFEDLAKQYQIHQRQPQTSFVSQSPSRNVLHKKRVPDQQGMQQQYRIFCENVNKKALHTWKDIKREFKNHYTLLVGITLTRKLLDHILYAGALACLLVSRSKEKKKRITLNRL